MSEPQLVALSLVDEETARHLVRQLDAIAKTDGNIKIHDAAIAVKKRGEHVKLRKMTSSSAAKGGVIGALGAGLSGIASIYRRHTIDDDMMRRAALELRTGQAALFVLYSGDWGASQELLRQTLHSHGIGYSEAMPDDMASTLQAASRMYMATESFDDIDTEQLEANAFDDDAQASEDYGAQDFAEESEWPAPLASSLENPAPENEFEQEEAFVDDNAAAYADASTVETDRMSPDELLLESYRVEAPEPETQGESGGFQDFDAVTAASQAAIIAAAEKAAQEEAAQTEAVQESSAHDEAPLEINEDASDLDIQQGNEMIEASAAVSEAGVQLSLLSLERRTNGLELGRIAGELSQIGEEVGALNMPLLSGFLSVRGERLQQLAAEVVAAAATANDLARILEANGRQVGDFGAIEIEEGRARLAAAQELTAQAAAVGAAGVTDDLAQL